MVLLSSFATSGDFSYSEKNAICSFSHPDDKAFSNSICEPLKARTWDGTNEDRTRRRREKKSTIQEMLKEANTVLIFVTKSYVTSTWCLDQLVIIFESKMKYGQKIFPIFYGVDQSQVENQTFDSFGKPLKQKSIEALREATKFQGLAIPNQADFRQSSNISGIIKAIKDKLKRYGSKLLPGTVKGLIPPVDIMKIEAAGEEEPEFLNQEEGQGSPENTSINEHEISCLKHISNASKIRLSTLEANYMKKILDLSKVHIQSLPETISSLVKLHKLLLKDVELLMELPSEIIELKNLEELDAEGTELTYLPREIGKLIQLERLKVSLYRRADSYIRRKKINAAIIPRGELSKLKHLKELSINVDPDCEWWDAEAEAVIKEIPDLTKLETLKFYFPTEYLLKRFLEVAMEVYKGLSDFRLIVGLHDPEILFCVPINLQREFEKSEKCLKCVGGEVDYKLIDKVLEHAESFFLDRHWTITKLSAYNLCNIVRCLLVECNEMNAIFDGSDFVQRDRFPQKLRYLSVHHMQKLRFVWTGPNVTGCLENLEILILHTLPELITVFNPDLLCDLKNLKELIVKNCPKITSLLTEEPRDSKNSDKAFAPNLKNVLLVHLPNFTSFSFLLNEAPKLEKVVVYNCPKLEKPSPDDAMYSKYHEIQDECNWSKEISSINETEYMIRIFNSLETSEKSAYRMKDQIEQGIFWIHGEAGIGKTTMVESVYNSSYDKFDVSCFLSNIRQYSRKPNGLVHLQEQMLASILPGEKPAKDVNDVEEGKSRIKDAVKDKRALIVLDDVDNLSQVKALIGNQDWYGPGSKIIVTVSDTALLKGYDVRKRHEVKSLTDTESLKLFMLHAFGTHEPNTDYENISRELVEHCGGMPLALVVLGSSLCGRSIKKYKSVNEKLKTISHPRQLDILKLCFRSLLEDPRDKKLFIYIAYFFLGEDKDYVTTILEGCGFHAGVGIRTLVDKCLLTIGPDNKLQMHQLLQHMASEIVENEEWAENLVRVWKHRDAVDDYLREKKKTEGIIVDLPVEEESSIETHAFEGMNTLTLLTLNNVQLSGGYAKFPNNLVWLSWRGSPLCSLPSEFPMEKLRVLDMDYRSLENVWRENKFPRTLKILNLSHSDDLIRTPEFSSLPNLESLILKDCINLETVHESVTKLERLRLLNLNGCKNLKELPTEIIHESSPEKLVLSSHSLHLIHPQPHVELESLTELYPKLHISN